MIVYSATKKQFSDDVFLGNITELLVTAVKDNLGHWTGESEVRSYKYSLQFMKSIVDDPDIPNDAMVALEYKIPQTSNRIDFILSGQNQSGQDVAVIVELKQWSEAETTDLDGIVSVPFYRGYSNKQLPHPSYQAWSYAFLLNSYNEAVYQGEIQLHPCAYLHNYKSDGKVNSDIYQSYIEKAPLFLEQDTLKLQQFLKSHVKYGDKNNVMYKIEHGRIRPSKALADALTSMLKGKQEFVMVDNQKVVFETALRLAKVSDEYNKHVLIVHGGPGTGKSVIAINLLQALTNLRLNAHYVSKNAAPRDVYQHKLTGLFTKSAISNMFKSSGSYIDIEPNTFDTLIVDEAHRLNQKSGLYGNRGDNQIKEIIKASKFSIFFIDEDQKVTLKDIGDAQKIQQYAHQQLATVHQMKLESQFRCNGSDGYIAWLDNSLQISETANTNLLDINYEFKVFDNPNQMQRAIEEKNKVNNKARTVAGYCWKWVKNNPAYKDIQIPEYNFAMKWNLASDGNLWIIKPESVAEAGCIHTSQGLEVDYIGVIIGPDLIVRSGRIITDPSKRASTDTSVRGWRKMMEQDPEQSRQILDRIIKNTYRTLMTRGSKGCYIFCTDEETRDYFKHAIGTIHNNGNSQ